MEGKSLVLVKDKFHINLKKSINNILAVPVVFDSKIHAIEILNDLLRENKIDKGIEEGTIQSLITDFHIDLKDYYCFCYKYKNNTKDLVVGYKIVEMIDTRSEY